MTTTQRSHKATGVTYHNGPDMIDLGIGEFKDRGCKYHPACLTCPLPVCLDGEEKVTAKAGRDAEIMRRWRAGETAAVIGKAVGLSTRWVQKVVAIAR